MASFHDTICEAIRIRGSSKPDAIDHFFSNFSERIKNGLRQAGVESREELIELVRQTGLVGVHQIGKKSKDEILAYLGII